MNGGTHFGDIINQHGDHNIGKVVSSASESNPRPQPRLWSGPPLIFINYRATDERAAFDIDAELTRRLGDGAVFRDGKMTVGTAFAEELIARASTCPVMISIIGVRWENAYGSRPLDDPADWVRREIATAFRDNVHVTPVLVGARPRPVAAELPDDIRRIAHLQALHLPAGHTGDDVRRLVETLLRTVPALANIRTFD
jgi:hypothetical protein